MSIEQYIRASCRSGQSGSAGLQTWSKSTGITADEEAALARITDYRWQRSVLEGDKPFEALPIAFGLRRLPGGRWALFRSTPVRRDHVGRPGSYIAHAFVFHPSIYGMLHPTVRYFHSLSFRDSLTEAEIQSTVRPPPLPTLDTLALPDGAGDLVSEILNFMQEHGSAKVAELIGESADGSAGRGPAVIAGSLRHCLMAILGCELYRLSPFPFITFAADCNFNRDFGGDEPYELCGNFGSRELAASWRDAHQAWLFNWAAPVPVDFAPAPWMDEFVATGALRHHAYMSPDDHRTLRLIDGWLAWHPPTKPDSEAGARQLLTHAAHSRNPHLRALAYERVSSTLDATLSVAKCHDVALLVLAQADDVRPDRDTSTARSIASAIVALCERSQLKSDTLSHLVTHLRPSPMGHCLRRVLTSTLAPQSDGDGADGAGDATALSLPVSEPTAAPPLVRIRLWAVLLGLQRDQPDSKLDAAFTNEFLGLLRDNRHVVSTLLDVGFRIDAPSFLPLLARSAATSAEAAHTLDEQIPVWCQGRADMDLVPVTRWLLSGGDFALAANALGHVLTNKRISSANLESLLQVVTTSLLDVDRRLTVTLLAAVARGTANSDAACVDVLMRTARAIRDTTAIARALQVAERHADRIVRSPAPERTRAVRSADDCARLVPTLAVPRLSALIWIAAVAADPRRFLTVSMLRTHLDAIQSMEHETRIVLLSDLVRSIFDLGGTAESTIDYALELLRVFGSDSAATGALSHVIDLRSGNYGLRLETFVRRLDVGTARIMASYVDDDVLGRWLVSAPPLWDDVQRRFGRFGRRADREVQQKFAARLPAPPRRWTRRA